MTPRFELSLLDGRASLQDVNAKTAVKLAGHVQFAYDTSQQATELAVQAIAALTGRTKGDVADDKAIAQALTARSAELVIRGHPRECRVVALHLHVRYGIDYDAILGGTEVGVRVAPIDDAPDGFATYRFDSDMRPLDALRVLVERWLKEAARYPITNEHAQRNAPKWRGLLQIGAAAGAPVRVVITGVTGAGKSTFLNGLLGRDVVPHSSGVCTAALLRLRKAPSSKEGFEVQWRASAEIERQIAALEAELKFATSKRGRTSIALGANVGEVSTAVNELADRAADLQTRIDTLRNAVRLARDNRGRLPLPHLAKYARNAPDSYAEAINSIDVYLDHPLLAHVEIVDAPGLRDGDQQRQKLLMRAFEGDAAWLYLAPADDRNNGCVDEWKHIKQLAHNDSSVLVLTKADGQPPDRGRTLGETMGARFLDYRGYGWKRPIDWCSCLLPAELGAVGHNASEHTLTQAFTNAKLPVLLNLPGKTETRRLEDFMTERRAEPEQWSTFVDFVLDASRLPAALRRVGAVLYEDAISRRVTEGQAALVHAAQEAVDHVVAAMGRSQQVLKAHDVIIEQRRQVDEAKGVLQGFTEQHASEVAEHQEMLEAIDEAAQIQLASFIASTEARMDGLEARFLKSFAEQSKAIWFSGDRHFPLVSELESPLSESAHQLLREHAATVGRVRADQRGNGVVLRDLLQGYVLLEVASVGEIVDQEKWNEWDSTTRERMSEAVQKKARRCVKGMTDAFKTRLKEFRMRAKGHLKEMEAELVQLINQQKREIAELEHGIMANKPGASREKAELVLAQLAEHKAAFEAFRTDLGRRTSVHP